MTPPIKPSRNEEEYFAKLEAERMERKRAEMAKLALNTERKSHYMRCPKCGGNLGTEEFHRIQVERCPDCHGLWLDAGEIEAIAGHPNEGHFGRVMSDFLGSLRKKK